MDLLRREANSGTLDHNGAGGVTVVVKDIWCSSGSVELIPSNEKFFSSDCVCVDLHSLYSDQPLICGTHVAFDRVHRNRIHAHLQKGTQAYQYAVLAQGKFVKQTNLNPIDPVEDYQLFCTPLARGVQNN